MFHLEKGFMSTKGLGFNCLTHEDCWLMYSFTFISLSKYLIGINNFPTFMPICSRATSGSIIQINCTVSDPFKKAILKLDQFNFQSSILHILSPFLLISMHFRSIFKVNLNPFFVCSSFLGSSRNKTVLEPFTIQIKQQILASLKTIWSSQVLIRMKSSSCFYRNSVDFWMEQGAEMVS